MTNIVWSAEVTAIGADSTDMLEGGFIILFGEPVPSELADYSIVHSSDRSHTRRRRRRHVRVGTADISYR